MSRSHRRRSQPLPAHSVQRPHGQGQGHPDGTDEPPSPEYAVEPLPPEGYERFGLVMYQQPGNTEATDGTLPEPRIPTPKVQMTYNGRVATTARCCQLGDARVFVRLQAVDPATDEAHSIDDRYMLVGDRQACTPSWSARGTKIIFRFPDLTCTTPGRYRLVFMLMILEPAFRARFRTNPYGEPVFTCTSESFTVYARGSLAPAYPRCNYTLALQDGPVGPPPTSTVTTANLPSDSESEGGYSGDDTPY